MIITLPANADHQTRTAYYLKLGKKPGVYPDDLISSDDVDGADEWIQRVEEGITKRVYQNLEQGLAGTVVNSTLHKFEKAVVGRAVGNPPVKITPEFAHDLLSQYVTGRALLELNHGKHAYFHPAGLRTHVDAIEARLKREWMGGGKTAERIMHEVQREIGRRISVLCMARDAEKKIEGILEEHEWVLPSGTSREALLQLARGAKPRIEDHMTVASLDTDTPGDVRHCHQLLRDAAALYAEKLVYGNSLQRRYDEIRIGEVLESLGFANALGAVREAVEAPFREMQKSGRGPCAGGRGLDL